MPNFLKSLYFALPAIAQDCAITALGYRRRWQRFGRIYCKHLDDLMESQWFSAEQFAQLQLQKLRHLLAECAMYVPYYQKKFSEIGFNTTDLKSLGDLRKLPILEKDTLRSQTEKFHNLAPGRKAIEVELTSGSTGAPLAIPMDRETISIAIALLERQYQWAGVSFFDKHARFCGAVVSSMDNPIRPYRWNWAWNQLLCSTYHMTQENMAKYAIVLTKFQPKYLHCYPSAIFAFSSWLNKTKQWQGKIRPKAVFTTAETLYDYQRDEIETAFDCKVFNQYGSAEGAPFIGQCESGGLHLSPESGIIEFLRDDDSPANPGEEAQMVVTSFRNFKVPLVRYRIGDYAILSEEICPCGRNMPLIKDIHGRCDDIMITTDRGIVGRLSQVTKVAPQSFAESQIEEIALDDFIFRYVPDPKYFQPSDLKKVTVDMHQRLGNNIHITFEELKIIRKGARGKYKAMIGLPRDKWPEKLR